MTAWAPSRVGGSAVPHRASEVSPSPTWESGGAGAGSAGGGVTSPGAALAAPAGLPICSGAARLEGGSSGGAGGAGAPPPAAVGPGAGAAAGVPAELGPCPPSACSPGATPGGVASGPAGGPACTGWADGPLPSPWGLGRFLRSGDGLASAIGEQNGGRNTRSQGRSALAGGPDGPAVLAAMRWRGRPAGAARLGPRFANSGGQVVPTHWTSAATLQAGQARPPLWCWPPPRANAATRSPGLRPSVACIAASPPRAARARPRQECSISPRRVQNAVRPRMGGPNYGPQVGGRALVRGQSRGFATRGRCSHHDRVLHLRGLLGSLWGRPGDQRSGNGHPAQCPGVPWLPHGQGHAVGQGCSVRGGGCHCGRLLATSGRPCDRGARRPDLRRKGLHRGSGFDSRENRLRSEAAGRRAQKAEERPSAEGSW